MRVTMLLADAAQVAEGKLYILGGGWTDVGPGPAPMAIALKIDIPWDETNRRHKWEIKLVDEDNKQITLGDNPLGMNGEFEAGRPPGHRTGTPITLPMAINLGPIPIPPGGRYIWKLYINGESKDTWEAAFNMRPLPGSFKPAQ